MRASIKILVFIILMLLIWSMLLLLTRWAEASNETPREQMVERLALGFTKAIRRESVKWYECGEPTPPELWNDRAAKMARHLLTALDEYKVKINPWGPWATIYKESRGNRCGIGPNPRAVAYKFKLIEPKAHRLWTEADIKSVIRSPRWGRRVADLGLGQVVWKRYARLKDGERIRIPTLEEMLTVKQGMRVVAYTMGRRMYWTRNKRLRRTPWIFWPGNVPDWNYHRDVLDIVQKMGGPMRDLY